MSRNTPGVLAKINAPLALLWLGGFIVTAVGYLVLTSSNAAQAEFYTSGSQDHGTYFSAQSGSILGSVLIGAGVLGLLLALAAHVIVRPAGVVAGVTDAEPAEDALGEKLDLSDDQPDHEKLNAVNADAVTPDETGVTAGTTSESTGRDAAGVEPDLEPTTAR